MEHKIPIWTFLLVIIVNKPFFISSNNTEIDSTFRLLAEGEKSIKFPNHSKNLILILGSTGAGKSAFTQWIAGDDSKLISKEVVEGAGEYIIEDGNRIGSSTTVSKTIFPELVIDIEHNSTVFYDCPGFSDTRSTSYDIAATYFTKEVADFSHSLKIILLVSYPAVQKGVDRISFVKLLRHATDFIKDIDQFKNSIAMIVTKVNNDYIRQGRNFIPVSDEIMINKIVSFLLEVKTDLENKLQMPDTSEREKTFCLNGVKFIDVVRQTENYTYSRIGIFRRPDEPGPLSNITLLQNGKEHINKLFHNNLIFTPRENHQFGYTVSDQSKNDITALTEEINKIIWKNINEIVEKIKIYYSECANKISRTIQLLITSRDNVYTNQTEAYEFITQQKAAEDFISILSNEVKNSINFQKLVNENEKNVIQLNISDQFQSILAQEKYFEFLQTVSDRKMQIGPFDSLFEQLDNNLLQSRLNIIKDAQNAVQVIDKKIKMNIEIITKVIEKYYLVKTDSFEIETIPTEMNNARMIISELTDAIGEGKEVLEKVNEYIIKLGLNNFELRHSVSAIFNFEKNLQFLKVLYFNDTKSSEISVSDSQQWIEDFKKVEGFLSESSMFYTFLNSMYDWFSQFDIQRDTTLYNVANLENWGKPGVSQGIEITKDNFRKFLFNVRPYNLEEYNAVQNISVTETHLKTLNNLLALTLKNQAQFECTSSSELRVRGDFIKFSDIFYASGELRWGCKANLDAINIFATNKVFIDTDFDGTGTKIKFSVIAPKWEIIGIRKITLDGAPGKDHHKARDGEKEGSKGDDGLAGNPGGAAGNFFGIGADIKHIEGLSILANGGKGGRGQDGGNGTDGPQGQAASVESYESRKEIAHFQNKCYIVRCRHIRVYIYYGLPNGFGGNGGNGGIGGLGGSAGKIQILNLNNFNDFPSSQNAPGLRGEIGLGGFGGNGGPAGNNMKVVCYSSFWNDWRSDDCYKQSDYIKKFKNTGFKNEESVFPSNRVSPSGSSGSSGVSTIGLKQPENPIAFQSISNLTTNYKVYLLENLRDQFKKRTLMQFIRQIDESSGMKISYDTIAILYDYLKLEEQHDNLQKLDDKMILYFYETILSNILTCANRLPKTKSSNQEKLVLSYLYTTILTKISAVKTKKRHQLVIDIEKYLALVEKDITTLSILQDKSNKAQKIDDYRKNYKTTIDRKINEAERLIQDQILPEITNVNILLERNVNQLIDETTVLLDQAYDEKDKLIKKKKEMEHYLVASWIFSGINFLGQALKCFGELGSAIGSTIENVNQVVEPLILGDKTETIQIIDLPEGVLSSFKSTIKFIKNQKATNFGTALNFINGELKNHTNHTITSIEEIETKYQSMLTTSNFTKIDVLEDELKTKLKETTIESATVTIEKLNKVLEFGRVGVNIFNKIKNDKKMMNEMDKAIDQASKKIQSMKQYKTQIYDSLIPTLNNMETNLDNVAGQLKTKSQVALDVQKWQVQSALKDMILWLRKFSKGFKVQDDLARCIEKLEEVMTTLINIYDRIQDFQEHKLLADYIADISSADANYKNLSDPKLAQAVNDLEKVIRSSLILERYEIAVGALKQQVFPVAHFYLSESILPSSLQLESSFENLVRKAIENVEKIGTKIQEYKASITQTDAFISKGWFSSEYISSKPFFIWKNTQHKYTIEQLLSGEKVVIYTNVLNSDPDKDAIKFNQIGINFNSPYPNITSDIKYMLKGFSVSATHLGNSYYRYKNDVYVINSDSQSIQFSFEKDKDGKPVHTNGVYDKITAGKLMLSPYAMWEIQLVSSTDHISFVELQKYADFVNLELVGYGNYLTKGTEVPNVDGYYQLDESYTIY